MKLPSCVFGVFLAGVLIAPGTARHGLAESIEVLTERSPFTQLTDEPGSGGEATEFVRLLMQRASLDYQLSYLPWRRAYRYVLEEPNVLIYPLARSKDREQQFAWVGELIPVTYYLFRRRDRDDVQLASLQDANNYRVGVVNYHVHHEHLEAQGIHSLQPVNSNLQNLKKALLGRIDLFPMSDGGLLPICRQNDIDCSQFEPIFKLEGISGGLYLAFSRQTDAATVTSAQNAYADLVANGTHKDLFSMRFREIEIFNRQWFEFTSETKTP